ELRGIAGSREGVQSAITVRRTNEDIEVFGFRPIPCVNRQRKRTTNQERHLRPIKSGESMSIEAGGPWVDSRFVEPITMKFHGLFTREYGERRARSNDGSTHLNRELSCLVLWSPSPSGAKLVPKARD